MTASQLFAGNKHNHGTNKCYYCGSECDDQYTTKDYVKDSFTNRDIVKYPQSKYVCFGCVYSLGGGEDTMPFIDGSTKERQNKRGMCPRMYSWVLDGKNNMAGTKAHIKQWRQLILNPPEPPFSIVLAESGQKQIIFRAPIAMDTENFNILLEDQVIEVNKEQLKNLLALALPVVAALGKPALTGEINFNSYNRYMEYHGEIESLEKWIEVKNQPLASLAAWLSPSKEDAQNEHRSTERREIPADISRACGQEPSTTTNGNRIDQGSGDQILFDFG
jgi:hypothetical protein